MRPLGIQTALGLLSSTFLCGCGPGAAPLSLLLVSVDTLRADHLGCYGYPRDTSPFLDAFAESNVVFTNVFTTSPKTGPSMASFFTGRYVQNHGVTQNEMALPEGQSMFAQRLPESFRKAALVANPTLAPERGYAAGFDEYRLVDADPAVLGDAAIRWLEENGDEHFFLWLHFLDPHGPYTPAAGLRDRFVDDEHYDASRRVALEYEGEPGLNPNYVLGVVPAYQRLGDVDVVDYYVAQYDAEILEVDEQIRRIVEHLDAAGGADSTLVVVTSDHGESLGENEYYFEHGMFVDEGSIHIPLLIRHPDVAGAVRVDALAQNVDLLPTLLAWLDLPPAQGIDGRDLSGLLLPGGSGQGRDYVYSCTPFPDEYPGFYETVRTRTHKLVRSGDGELAYYELGPDGSESPRELADLPPEDRDAWTQRIGAFGRRSAPRGRAVKLPEVLRKRLESLGYVD